MPLFIPTSGLTSDPFPEIQLSKARFYNLDTNEYMYFQFNPETFEYELAHKWAEILWKGDTRGGDLQFVGSGPRTFTLPLLYIAEPSAPRIKHKLENQVSPAPEQPSVSVDFEQIEITFYRWMRPIPKLGRPARLNVSIGPRGFSGVIVRYRPQITTFFADGTAREANIQLEFREWRVLKNT